MIKLNIGIVFIGKPQWEAGWPYLGYNNETCIKLIKDYLENSFPELMYIWYEILTNYNANLVKEIKNSIKDVDGVIIFTIGHYGDPGIVQAGIEIIESQKPVILTNLIYRGDHTFTKIFSSIKNKNFKILPISIEKLENLSESIRILIKLLKLRGNKILVYAPEKIEMNWQKILELFNPERNRIRIKDPEFLEKVINLSSDQRFEFFTDIEGKDQAHQWRRDEDRYSRNLKEIFNIEMIKGNPEEIMDFYDNVDEEDANKIVEKWKEEALRVEPSENTLLNSAKLYIALKTLLSEKKFNIFTPDCGTFLLTGVLPAYPCMAFMELIKDNIYGICESDMDCTISYLFGLYLTNRPGFVSNHTLDTSNNQITYMHCLAPNKLYGNTGPKSDYEILYHGETHYLGASPCVKFPVGEYVTTIKISILNKKIALRKGKIIDNVVDKNGCVSKMLVEGNVSKIMDNYDWDTFGWHRVTFIGDWKNDFITGAKLLGLKVIEEDI
ncbi:MAG: hypothetical protein ACFFBY_13820 [Promethearchaeota archaeon]